MSLQGGAQRARSAAIGQTFINPAREGIRVPRVGKSEGTHLDFEFLAGKHPLQ